MQDDSGHRILGLTVLVVGAEVGDDARHVELPRAGMDSIDMRSETFLLSVFW